MSEQVCKHCGNVIEPDMERRTGWKHVDLMSPTFHPGVCGGKAEPEAAPASEAQAPAAPHYRINSDGALAQSDIGTLVTLPDHLAEIASLRAELAQLLARVAILDAQEVELPRLVEDGPPVDEDDVQRSYLEQRERQLLDAQRAIQAWREVAHRQHDALRDVLRGNDLATKRKQSIAHWRDSDFRRQGYKAIVAYDALAGKGE